jgi:hypothetical protein
LAIIFAVIYLAEDLVNWFILAFVLISIPVSIVNQVVFRSRWKQLATQTNLNFETKGTFGFLANPQLTGRYRGYTVILDIFSRSTGRYRSHYTRFKLTFPFENPEPFSVKKHNIFHTNKLQIEDQEIGMKYTFKASSPRPIDRLIRQNRIRQSFLDLHPQVRGLEFSVSENGITFIERGRIKDTAYLQAVLNFLVQLSDLIQQQAQGFHFDR